MGIEPTLPEGNRILSPARLPVPPLRRSFHGTRRTPASDTRRTGVRALACVQPPQTGYSPDQTPLAQTGDGGGSVRTQLQGSCAGRSVRGARVRSRRLRRRRRRIEGSTQRRRRRRQRHGAAGVVVLEHLLRGQTATPDFIVASDLPLQGAGRAQTTEMVQAIKFALKQRDFKAGDYKIGYQSCDDSTAQAGAWDSAKCASNARAYAGNKSRHRRGRNVQLRVREDHRPGPEPREPGPGRDGQPREHEPGPHDGRARRGARRAGQVLPDRQAQLRPRRRERPDPGPGRRAVREGASGSRRSSSSTTSRRTASASPRRSRARRRSSACTVAGFKGWDAKQSSYEALANAIKQTGADGDLPRRDHLQQRREADQGPEARRPGRDADRSGRLLRSEVERHRVRRLVRRASRASRRRA